MKLIRDEFRGGYRYWFYCPGCRHAHSYTVGCAGLVNQNWTFDPAAVSFTPSLRVYVTNPETKAETTCCHLFVTNGNIVFCGDCPHDHNGRTVNLPEFPEGYGLPEPYEVIA